MSKTGLGIIISALTLLTIITVIAAPLEDLGVGEERIQELKDGAVLAVSIGAFFAILAFNINMLGAMFGSGLIALGTAIVAGSGFWSAWLQSPWPCWELLPSWQGPFWRWTF